MQACKKDARVAVKAPLIKYLHDHREPVRGAFGAKRLSVRKMFFDGSAAPYEPNT